MIKISIINIKYKNKIIKEKNKRIIKNKNN